MIRLHFSATPREDARCPVCLIPLVSDVWRVVHDIAYCPHCAYSGEQWIRQARINARWHLRRLHEGSKWYTANGIFFYISNVPFAFIPARLNDYSHSCDPDNT